LTNAAEQHGELGRVFDLLGAPEDYDAPPGRQAVIQLVRLESNGIPARRVGEAPIELSAKEHVPVQDRVV
jgi:hypothetical protein